MKLGNQTTSDKQVGNSAKAKRSLLTFTNQTIQSILPFSTEIACRKNDPLKLHGGEQRSIYYVHKGAIEVSYTDKGTKITVALIGAGQFFGEIGFFDGGSRVRDIKAMQDSNIRVFNEDALLDLQEHDPVLYGNFISYLAQSICKKFRRVLEEREPLSNYAASLSTRRRSRNYTESQPIQKTLLQSDEWRLINHHVEKIKSRFFDLSYALQKDSTPEISEDHRAECYSILSSFSDNLGNFKDILKHPEDENVLWGYLFKEAFPFIMRSRFAERAYYKPKGYAGDFLMMEHIYLNQPEGDGKIGKLVDAWLLQRPGTKAIRGRRKLLSGQLETISRQRLEQGETIQIMNLACGPNRELFDFLSNCDYSSKIEALCVDIDSEALQYTNQHVNTFPHMASIRFMNENLVKWALGKVSQNIGMQDIIYSAGLSDYLDRKLFQALVSRCHEHLKPGGQLVIGNFAPFDDQLFMDHILQWELIYRTEDELKELFIDTPFGKNVRIISEQEQVNLFAVATK